MDASVVASWVIQGEPYQQNALKLKEDHLLGKISLSAPAVIAQEVGNALWKGVKLKRIAEADAREALQSLDDMKIELHDLFWSQISDTLRIASKLDLTVYDAAYLFISNKTKACVVTGDNKMYEKAKKDFRISHIKSYM